MKKLLGGMACSIMGFAKAFQLEPYEGRLILPDGCRERRLDSNHGCR
jgi:hypothetical protein